MVDLSFARPVLPLLLALLEADPAVSLAAARTVARALREPGYLELVRENQLSPLIYHSLTRQARHQIGEVPHLAVLRDDYGRSLTEAVRQDRETRDILVRLRAAGVECLLLKGAHLRRLVYAEPALRPMGDLDLLVPPQQHGQASQILTEMGYRPVPWTPDLAPGYLERFEFEMAFAPPPGRRLLVDLHWEIREVGTLYCLPYDPLRALSRPIDFQGVPVHGLGPEHLLIHLSLHLIDEGNCAGLAKILDLALVAGQPDLNWELLLRETARLEARGGVWIVLSLLDDLLPGLAPPKVLAPLQAYRPPFLERLILRGGSRGEAVSHLAHVWRRLDPADWLRYLWPRLWPQPEYLIANLGKVDRPAYWRRFLRRWFRTLDT